MGRLIAIVVIAGGLAACSKSPQEASRDYMTRGDAYTSKGRYRDAAIEYRNAIKQQPQMAEAHQKLADAAARSKDRTTVVQELLRLADLEPNDGAAQVRAGALYLLAGRFNDASARADAALRLDADDAGAHLILGEALTALNERARGEQSLREAVRLAPQSVEARVALASAEWTGGRRTDAERDCRAALALQPTAALPNRALALLLMATGRANQAEPYWKVVARNPPGDPFTLADYFVAQGREGDATDELRTLTARPDLRDPAETRLAALGVAQGRNAEAARLLDGVLSRNAQSVSALVLRARLQARQGDLHGALVSAQQAERAQPTSAEAFYAEGLVAAALGDGANAGRALQKAVALAPGAVAPLLALARLALSSAHPADALPWAERAARTQPSDLVVRQTLVDALLAADQVPRADREAAANAAAWPQLPSIQAQRGIVKLAAHDATAARDAFAAALARDPASLVALGGLTRLDLEAHRQAAAIDRLEAALRTTQTSALLRLAGETYLRAGVLDKAEARLKQATAMDPHETGGAELLAQVYANEQRNSDAEAEYERVLAVHPDAPVAANNLAWMYLEDGRIDEALRLALVAKDGLAHSPEVNDTLGWIYIQKNQARNAIPLLAMSVQSQPDNPAYQYHLAVAYARAGDVAAAREAVDRALASPAVFAAREPAVALARTLRNEAQ